MSEQELINGMHEMCEESLSPDKFEKWEEVKKWLETNRDTNKLVKNNVDLDDVSVSALLEERKQYKLTEIWGCDEEDLNDKERYQLNVDLGIIKDFLVWMHSR